MCFYVLHSTDTTAEEASQTQKRSRQRGSASKGSLGDRAKIGTYARAWLLETPILTHPWVTTSPRIWPNYVACLTSTLFAVPPCATHRCSRCCWSHLVACHRSAAIARGSSWEWDIAWVTWGACEIRGDGQAGFRTYRSARFAPAANFEGYSARSGQAASPTAKVPYACKLVHQSTGVARPWRSRSAAATTAAATWHRFGSWRSYNMAWPKGVVTNHGSAYSWGEWRSIW
mmetsp:Transcript_114958/g.297961  ORF Transcript_114958/g.297961 Transcript_114958/m.297961 type:complete len:230 (-) Transcript_114958:130-819(-)